MKAFDLELVSPCNAKRDFCPQKFRSVKRQRRYMDEATIDKLTDEIAEMAQTERIISDSAEWVKIFCANTS